MTVTVRLAERGDVRQLLDLIHAHAVFEGTAASITGSQLDRLLLMEHPPVRLIVAIIGARLVGYAAVTFDFSLWRASRWAHLDCLFVEEGQRGSGVGTRLFEHGVQLAAHEDADLIEGQTPGWNGDAIGFYRRRGCTVLEKARFNLRLRRDTSRAGSTEATGCPT